LFEASLELAREVGDKRIIAHLLLKLGEVAQSQGDYTRATMSYDESLALSQVLGFKDNLGWLLYHLGEVAQHQDNAQRAVALFTESLALFREQAFKVGIAFCLMGLGVMVSKAGEALPPAGEHAARLFGAAEALIETSGVQMSFPQRITSERNVATIRTQLTEATFAAAWTAGRRLTMEQAIAAALAPTPPPQAAARARIGPS
jgi:tetratricopeptide (TPR) repeat protein